METDVQLFKYPRTPHLKGSRLQVGDEDVGAIPFERIAGEHLVIEEKIDGGNVGISFDGGGDLLIQSRGHYLTGGDHAHFDPLKTWANVHADAFLDVLQDRYIMFGEWCYAVHSEFYDQLPHYFLEFDVFDRTQEVFLSTQARRALLRELPVTSVPVLSEGAFTRPRQVTDLLGPSLYKSADWRQRYVEAAEHAGVAQDKALSWVDDSDLAEGLYIKVEREGEVVGRLKYVRADFVQAIKDTGTHWADRPMIVNQLAPGVDIYDIEPKPVAGL